LQDTEEENNVHKYDDGQGDTAEGVGEKWNLIAVNHQPAGHPAKGHDTEYQKRSDVEEAVESVDGMLAGYTLNNEKLPQVEKNRIDFNQKSNYGVADIAVSQLCQTEASNDAKMMDHQFERAPLSVIDGHVDKVVDEIADRHGDQQQRRHRISCDQIFSQLGMPVKTNNINNNRSLILAPAGSS